MPLSIGIIGGGSGLSSAEVQALIDVSLVSSGSIPDVNGTPASVNEGEMWKDSSQTPAKLMMYKDGVAREVDAKGDVEFVDLAGNTIATD